MSHLQYLQNYKRHVPTPIFCDELLAVTHYTPITYLLNKSSYSLESSDNSAGVNSPVNLM